MKEKRIAKIKRWQLIRLRCKDATVDLSALDALTVGRRAFSRKKQLQSVTLPTELSAIKTEAFLKCRSLTDVTLGKQNTVGISEKAFFACTALREVRNSEMIFSIGKRAFAQCSALETITLGRELKRIGEHAFWGCCALTELVIPSCAEEIGEGAFAHCSALRQATAEEGLTILAPHMFSGCTSLFDVTLPESLSALPHGIFRNCSALQEVRIPVGIKRIEKKAFKGCKLLSRVEIELGCERIVAHAFAGCPSLTEVTLPRTVKRLGFGAFGLGKRKEKTVLYVENEYMLRRMKRLLLLCGSWQCTRAVLVGKTVAERKRERRRTTLEQEPTHLIDSTVTFEQKPLVYALTEQSASEQEPLAKSPSAEENAE